MLQGETKLELLRNGQVVHREEKHNTITPWASNALNQGNFNLLMNKAKAFPIKQWFNGCLLTDKDNDATTSLIAHDSTVTAQASNDAYTGTNLRRGSFNSNESGDVTGGYRFVWDWTTSQGNGDIKSICLTRPSIGAADLTTGSTAPDVVCNEYLNASSGNFVTATSFYNGTINILDYDNEKAYYLYYESEKIKCCEYDINTWRYHVLGDVCAASTRTDHEITIPSPIANYTLYSASVSYDGEYFYFIHAIQNTNNFDIWKIDPSDWTCTYTRHVYAGVTTCRHGYSYYIPGNLYLVDNGYIWILSYNLTKMYKCSLTNDADITEYNCPYYVNDNAMNGPMFKLPNGDFYKFYRNYGTVNTMYYHNGQFYRGAVNWYDYTLNYEAGHPHSNSYGTVVVHKRINAADTIGWFLLTIFPHVSTVNNLTTNVTKTPELTMKLTYTIREGS